MIGQGRAARLFDRKRKNGDLEMQRETFGRFTIETSGPGPRSGGKVWVRFVDTESKSRVANVGELLEPSAVEGRIAKFKATHPVEVMA